MVLERYKEIERTIITNYRKKIWNRFVKGVKEYKMIKDGDKIAVCMSGGKDSMLLAKCMQELQRHGEIDFELVFLCMNPGYNNENMQKILNNAEILNIPLTIFESDIFDRVSNIEDHPCYVCARMRRGYLYNNARDLGCNKIALGHHFDDVIETIVMGMIYGAQMQTMMPKLHSSFHEGMELIRPLYYVKEADIISWQNKNELEFIKCACKITEKNSCEDEEGSKRQEVKKLIAEFRKKNKYIDMNIFRSAQNVNLDTILSYRRGENFYSFLDDYEEEV